jgi:uncharacterized Zn-binding protein involved in type VI secretion
MGAPVAGVGRDVAGGTIGAGAVTTVYNCGVLCVGPGHVVAGHGTSPHSSPTIVGPGNPMIRVQGLPICRVGIDKASCGCVIAGGATVFAA